VNRNMASNWFYHNGTDKVGPFTETEISKLLSIGIISSTSLVCFKDEPWCSLEESQLNKSELILVDPPSSEKLVLMHEDELSRESPLNKVDQSFVVDEKRSIEGDRSVWSKLPVYPWRRFLAKTLDGVVLMYLYMALVFLAFRMAPVFSLNHLSDLIENDLFNLFVFVFLSIFINGAFLGYAGTTIGKKLFGINVLAANGEPIGVIKGINREVKVVLIGQGLFIPLISFFTQIGAYDRLKKDKTTTWDKSMGCDVWYLPGNSNLRVRAFLGVATILGSIVFFIVLSV